jgi:hypothetical protein
MIKYIIYEETDEYLTYEMERLIEYHQKNKDLPEFTKIAEIIEGVKYDKPFLKDTFLLELKDNEMVPHRELFFSIQHNDKDFTIVLRHLMPGRDDILEGTIFIYTRINWVHLIYTHIYDKSHIFKYLESFL